MARLASLTFLASALPGALAWGSMGHATIAYIATNFVAPETKTYMQQLLGDTTDDYLANVASWADSYRYTTEGAFTSTFHYIDALDDPPHSCGIDLERDCGPTGCIVSAHANYTQRLLLGPALDLEQRQIAAKMVIHFTGDIGQPLHCENLEAGGNGIAVEFNGTDTNLHAAWDTNIPQSITGTGSVLAVAKAWASTLSTAIASGEFRAAARCWVQGLSLEDPEATALSWAAESNKFVCTVVLPEGREAVEGLDISGAYTTNAQPTVSMQVAKQGYRLAKWLDAIVAEVA
ncbi:Putative S1/P1 nuclease, phospholipase C/P1 nuclease domain superfamily [Colletotrichum destructivum]|uniref:S1/P1 nuclease, phospholipase C/P1 nuclease domain superfamily n=1 Tax=Colletotrichum destructivum TaxID=34406 RepID=A0AAX4IRS8_9PEZI|nr:Putative S1/P1 nuclease, phospholipase C/P1 nuclease domain superfamily [Colletotrichum destructivum]